MFNQSEDIGEAEQGISIHFNSIPFQLDYLCDTRENIFVRELNKEAMAFLKKHNNLQRLLNETKAVPKWVYVPSGEE